MRNTPRGVSEGGILGLLHFISHVYKTVVCFMCQEEEEEEMMDHSLLILFIFLK
ncbi:hypothetical protein HanRHA438_Chr01g0002811 [Helianthus annuus]|nr:hypothetical protein HanRHA438_Chr01g0002811 [Helianthus annuus]